jgi:hypothetical protein
MGVSLLSAWVHELLAQRTTLLGWRPSSCACCAPAAASGVLGGDAAWQRHQTLMRCFLCRTVISPDRGWRAGRIAGCALVRGSEIAGGGSGSLARQPLVATAQGARHADHRPHV